METADIILMADNLDKLPHTMKLSKKDLTIITPGNYSDHAE
jgi:Cd2+/Zn2+-exporting ATPase